MDTSDTMTHDVASIPAMSEVPRGRIAMWWLVASEIVIFGGAVCCYLMFRFRHPEWGALAAHTSTPMGALNTLVLLTSSLNMVLAHSAAERQDIRAACRNMIMAMLLGCVFLVVKAIEYTAEIRQGYTITADLFWSFYYLLTGLHALHVIAGVTAIFFVMLSASKRRHLHRVEMAGIYWHLVDIVWLFLFPLLYIAG
ncbi:MAG: cytochrome c oxidase subunit 3 [Lentisphaeria bacterium]|nr:cytochrome c oxidase subunit 3 [Lentisphaeria bacterium]MDP7743283.1 cytochrome c oxidase subunit 3 [Lentisphaeria bacterium]